MRRAMLSTAVLWTDLTDSEMVSGTIALGERSILVTCFCLNAEDDILLQIVSVQ